MATTHKIQQGQTLADAALIHFGYLESLADIAALNGVSMTAEASTGSLVNLPNLTLDRSEERRVGKEC